MGTKILSFESEKQGKLHTHSVWDRLWEIPKNFWFLVSRIVRSNDSLKQLYLWLWWNIDNTGDVEASTWLKWLLGKQYIYLCEQLLNASDNTNITKIDLINELMNWCYHITKQTETTEIVALDHYEYLWKMSLNRGTRAEWLVDNYNYHSIIKIDLPFRDKYLNRLKRLITIMEQCQSKKFDYTDTSHL